MDLAEPGAPSDRAHPPVGGATVEPTAIVAEQDRARGPLADGQIDGSSRSGHERNHGRLVALASEPQRAVASLEAEILASMARTYSSTAPVGGNPAFNVAKR